MKHLPLESDLTWAPTREPEFRKLAVGLVLAPKGMQGLDAGTYWGLLALRVHWLMEKEKNPDEAADWTVEEFTLAGLLTSLDKDKFHQMPKEWGSLLVRESPLIRERIKELVLAGETFPLRPVHSRENLEFFTEISLAEWVAAVI